MKTFLIYLINFFLVGLIIRRVVVIDNDKAHLIYLFYYLALLMFNFLAGAALRLMNRETHRTFWHVCIWMVCLFIPIYLVLLMM